MPYPAAGSPVKSNDHTHIYNLRGYCWCGAHRDDWLRNEDMQERIGKAFGKLAEEPKP